MEARSAIEGAKFLRSPWESVVGASGEEVRRGRSMILHENALETLCGRVGSSFRT